MFIWTVQDVIGLGILALGATTFAILWIYLTVRDKFKSWRNQ